MSNPADSDVVRVPETDAESRDPREHHYGLSPPIEAVWCSRQEFAIFNNRRIYNTNNVDYITVDWRCTCYIYTAGARPDSPNFAALGGVIHIVMVHSGSVTSTLTRGHQNFEIEIAANTGTNRATPAVCLPGFSVKEGNNWTARIDFHRSMPLFINGGNGTTVFDARYVHQYQLFRMEQSGRVVNNQIEAVFRPEPGSGWNSPRALNMLTVFTQTEPRRWPVNFTFRAIGTFGNNRIPATNTRAINLGFDV